MLKHLVLIWAIAMWALVSMYIYLAFKAFDKPTVEPPVHDSEGGRLRPPRQRQD
jgi:hypothetical protein